jgi:hypothetical protein
MKTSKIGELNFKKFKTEIRATFESVKRLEKDKISLAHLIPSAGFWYEGELFPELDENGDGKPDERFGKSFILSYFMPENEFRSLEPHALFMNSLRIKGTKLNYACSKNV